MPTLHQFARQLRLQQTDCERLIWQKLRARQVLDLKFRRQHPCPPYVLDFYCVELQLAVELAAQHLGVEERADQPFAFRTNPVGNLILVCIWTDFSLIM